MSTKQFSGSASLLKHAAELQLLDQRAQLVGFGFDGEQAGVIAFFLAHLVQLGVVGQLARQFVQRDNHAGERFLFLAQLLGLLRVVPDRGVFQRCVDGAQTFELGIEVKDTSVTLACAVLRSARVVPMRLMRSASMVRILCVL